MTPIAHLFKVTNETVLLDYSDMLALSPGPAQLSTACSTEFFVRMWGDPSSEATQMPHV